MNSKKILVLGIGNDILTDDGIGLKLVADLSHRHFPACVEFKQTTLGGLDILEMLKGYHEVVFLDSIRTKDGHPGETYYLSPEHFGETAHLTNLHDISFPDALKLGGKLNMELPERMHIFAVEILEDRVFSGSLSPELESEYHTILRDAEQCLRDIVMENYPVV